MDWINFTISNDTTSCRRGDDTQRRWRGEKEELQFDWGGGSRPYPTTPTHNYTHTSSLVYVIDPRLVMDQTLNPITGVDPNSLLININIVYIIY